MSVRGYEAEPVGFEEAGPLLRCWTCGFRQRVSDGLSTDQVDALVVDLEDEEEREAALGAHDVQFCVFDGCPRCGDGIDVG